MRSAKLKYDYIQTWPLQIVRHSVSAVENLARRLAAQSGAVGDVTPILATFVTHRGRAFPSSTSSRNEVLHCKIHDSRISSQLVSIVSYSPTNPSNPIRLHCKKKAILSSSSIVLPVYFSFNSSVVLREIDRHISKKVTFNLSFQLKVKVCILLIQECFITFLIL